jgi:hypothetical protein
MASVYLKRGTWYASYKDATGRRRNVSTKATTKTEARRLAADLERQAERARFGLEPLPSDSTLTLGQLCTWWLDERCPEASVAIEARRLGKHVLRTALGAFRCGSRRPPRSSRASGGWSAKGSDLRP